MILIDTSVWVDHLRSRSHDLEELLHHRSVLCHPLIVGELALGNLKPRRPTLERLMALPSAELVNQVDVLSLIEREHLFGTGLGLIDTHLLAAALKSGCRLWTMDKRLSGIAARLGLAFEPGVQ